VENGGHVSVMGELEELNAADELEELRLGSDDDDDDNDDDEEDDNKVTETKRTRRQRWDAP
jgi:hypothetical protein